MSNSIFKKWYVSAFISLLALVLVGPVSIKLFEIPLTLQTLVICLISWHFGFPAVIATIAYIVLGINGLPIFSGFEANPTILTSSSAGFVLAFPMMSLFIVFIRKKLNASFTKSISLFILAHGFLILDAFVYNRFAGLAFPSIEKILLYLMPSALIKSLFAAIFILIIMKLKKEKVF